MVNLASFSAEALAVLQRAKAIAGAAQDGKPVGPPPLALARALLSRDEDGLALVQRLAPDDAILAQTLSDLLEEPPGPAPSESVAPPAATLAVLEQAQALARTGRVEPLHLWCATMGSPDADLEQWLAGHGLRPAARAAAGRRALHGSVPPPAPAAESPRPDTLPPQARQTLLRFCTDLTAAARAGTFQPPIGRRELFERLCEQLLRLGKRNVVLTGEGGVGKTTLVRYLAWVIAHDPDALPTQLRQCDVFSLDLLRLRMGSSLVGELEARMRDLLAVLERYGDRIVLFIDEMHVIVGSPVGGSAFDLANALKPVLAEGSVRCIGATTPVEYTRSIATDPALARRFAELRVPPLSAPDTLHLLQTERERYEQAFGGTIEEEALKTVIDLAQRYLPNRQFPDKGVDLLDATCAHAAFHRLARVTPALVRAVLARDLDLPEVDEPEMTVTRIEAMLQEAIVGQRTACALIARALVRGFRLGIDHTTPRAVLFFTGPSRVGKTLAAETVGRILCARREQFLRIDMNEFVGAVGGHGGERAVHRLLGPPPPYVGWERGGLLTNQITANPASVILLDEFEKAAPQVQDIFLGIFDRGVVVNGLGHTVSCRDCYFLLTSNVVTDLSPLQATTESAARRALQATGALRPEFINRLSAVVPFVPLEAEALQELARRAWEQLQRSTLQSHGLALRAVPEVQAITGALARAALRAAVPERSPVGFGTGHSAASEPQSGDAQMLAAEFQLQITGPVEHLLEQQEQDAPSPDWIEVRLTNRPSGVSVRAAVLTPVVLLVHGSEEEAAALQQRLPEALWQAVPEGTLLNEALDRRAPDAVPVIIAPAGRPDLWASLLERRAQLPFLGLVRRVETPGQQQPDADPPALLVGSPDHDDPLRAYLAACTAQARALQRRRRLLDLLDRFEAEGHDQTAYDLHAAPVRVEGGMQR
jgi:ATP-dependent Clp protease ATP-binding subunit ClpA